MDIKTITEVEKLLSVSDSATVYVEDGGEFRRVDVDAMPMVCIDSDGMFYAMVEEG